MWIWEFELLSQSFTEFLTGVPDSKSYCLLLQQVNCQNWSVRQQAGLGDEQVLDSITEAIKAKKTYWSHFPPGALNFQWNKILEKSIDLPFLLCYTGDEDQRRFVLFYAQVCNLNLDFHPDSYNFAVCTALSAHSLPYLVPPFVTVLLS